MLSNVFKVFAKDVKLLISNFLILLISSYLITQVVNNFGNAIIQSGSNNLDSDSFVMLISIFASTGSILFLITIMIINMNQSILITSRRKRLESLRTLGYTSFKIKRLLFLELLILAIIAMSISMPTAYATKQVVINYLKDIDAIGPSVFNNDYWYLYLISSGMILLALFFALAFTTRYLNKWNKETNIKKKKNIWRYIFGLITLGGGIALITIKPILAGGLGMGMVIISAPLLVSSIALLYKPLFIFSLSLFEKLFRKGSLWWMSIKSAKRSIVTLSGVITLTVASVVSGLVGVEVSGILKDATRYNTNIYLQTDSANDVYNNVYVNKEEKSLSEVTKDITDLENELLISQSKSFKLKEASGEEYGNETTVTTLVGNRDMVYLDNLKIDETLWKSKNSIITSKDKFGIGDYIQLYIDSAYVDFIVAGTFNQQMRYSGFPSSFVKYEDIEKSFSEINPYFVLSKSDHVFDNPDYEKADINAILSSSTKISDAIMFAITLIIITYSIITIISIAYILHLNKKKEKKQLRNIGLLKSQIKKFNLLTISIISILSSLIAMGIIMVINVQFSQANNYETIIVHGKTLFITIVSLGALLPIVIAFIFDLFTKD